MIPLKALILCLFLSKVYMEWLPSQKNIYNMSFACLSLRSVLILKINVNVWKIICWNLFWQLSHPNYFWNISSACNLDLKYTVTLRIIKKEMVFTYTLFYWEISLKKQKSRNHPTSPASFQSNSSNQIYFIKTVCVCRAGSNGPFQL